MNRETYPSQLFPLRGDLSAEAGDVAVTVVGIQGIDVSDAAPDDQQVLTYLSSTSEWTPRSAGNSSIQVNSVGVSDDYVISVNLPLGLSDSPTLVNGA